MVRSQSSSLVSSTDFVNMTPALLTRMSTRPKRSTVARTSSLTSPDDDTSARTESASPPPFLMESTTAWASRSLPTQLTVTFAPSAAKRSAMALPMPRDEPVTIPTLFASLLSLMSPLLLGRAAGGHRPVVDQLASALGPHVVMKVEGRPDLPGDEVDMAAERGRAVLDAHDAPTYVGDEMVWMPADHGAANRHRAAKRQVHHEQL